jgi:IclR family transcriptional regulator, KDG regulon repressor
MPITTQKVRPKDGIQSVALAFQIIESLVASGRSQGVTELARELGTSKTRIYNYLQTLSQLGYIAKQEESDKYKLGFRVSQLGGAGANELNLVSVSRDLMEQAAKASSCTVILSKFQDNNLVTVDQVEGAALVKVSVAMGITLALHSTAQGKIALAFGPEEMLSKVCARRLQAFTKFTMTDPQKLRAEIAKVRERGWASISGETVIGVNAIALPILDRERRLVGTLGVLGTTDTLPSDALSKNARLLKRATTAIASRIAR